MFSKAFANRSWNVYESQLRANKRRIGASYNAHKWGSIVTIIAIYVHLQEHCTQSTQHYIQEEYWPQVSSKIIIHYRT
jgi:hypothetical protein